MKQNWIVLTVLIAIALLATRLGAVLPAVGAPMFAILLGIAFSKFANSHNLQSASRPISKSLLQYSIIGIGFGMSVLQIFHYGISTLPFMVVTAGFTIGLSWWIGKWMGLSKHSRLLVGAGTSICGGSAIVTMACVLRSKDSETIPALSTIFFYNILAAFLFPFLGHTFHMNDYNFGFWAGTAINDTSSVLAAAFTFSDASGQIATMVKMTRTLLIIPLALLFSFARENDGEEFSFKKVIPIPLLGFIAAAGLRWIIGDTSPQLVQGVSVLSHFLLAMAVAGIGLQMELAKIFKEARKMVILGGILWVALSLLSLFLLQVLEAPTR